MNQQKHPDQGLLAGKVALVTGSGGGLGRAYAVALAAAGAKVVINDVGASLQGDGESVGPAQETLALIQANGGEAVINTDSVAQWVGAQHMVQCAQDTFSGLDIVVNNAGVLRDAIFHKMAPEEWLAVIDVHLTGSFMVSRAAAPWFRQQQSGSYIHTTSTSGLIGNVGQANYAAAKLGIVGLSQSIALDMNRFGVRSNCLAPFAWSRMTNAIPTETPEQQVRVAKLQQMTPDKNAPLVVFLASDLAHEVNGQVFCTRHNEVFLMSATRPIRSVQRDQGWHGRSIAEHAHQAFKAHYQPLQTSAEVFSWDPL
ncbi:MAG: SDR family NAD(P)-dependent oxidoreductase [Neisseriaceae bacterium]|nr:SDR family NAD(P)-dependent oxidoreductase [Neisseriaceae bacterium]